MSWTQPKFTDLISQPKKKARLSQNENQFIKPDPPRPPKPKIINWDSIKPKTKEELVVNKKKIEEVESWLEKLKDNKGNSRILLVLGPSGSGKLTTIQVLCKSLKLGVTEWVNPVQVEYDPQHTMFYTSQLKSFAEFIIRATRYKSVLSPSISKRLIVVKDIPNIFLRDKSLFHECIKQYSSVKDINIVFILSDSSLAKDLFPDELKFNHNVHTINFNAITQRSITTALTSISRKLGLPSSQYITEVSNTCEGDLRNAIQTLWFLCPKGNHKKPVVNKKVVQGSRGKAGKTEGYFSGLQNDPTLDIFRGLGRTLYAKRESSGKLHHDPFEVSESFESTPNLFVNMLHENYLNIFSSLDSARKGAECLAGCDIFLSEWRENDSSKKIGLASTAFGLMHHNVDPVRKFQSFNKYKNPENVLSEFRGSIVASFESLDVIDHVLDRFPYLKHLPHSCDDKQKKILTEFDLK